MKIPVRGVLLKVLSRYLTKDEFTALIKEFETGKRITDPMFVEILKQHFDFERWTKAPLIKQDIWLYNYFKYEFAGKLKFSGLMNKYMFTAFVFNDIDFFETAEQLNRKKPNVPKGVTYIPNEISPQTANHILSGKKEPGGAA